MRKNDSDEEDTQDAEDPDNEDADQERWVFVGQGCSSRVVLDEAQKAKTVRSLITMQIMSSEAVGFECGDAKVLS